MCEGRTGSYLSASITWSFQHLISKDKDSLCKERENTSGKYQTFWLIKAVFGNLDCMLYYLIFVSRGLRMGALKEGKEDKMVILLPFILLPQSFLPFILVRSHL